MRRSAAPLALRCTSALGVLLCALLAGWRCGGSRPVTADAPGPASGPVVLLVSIDGFRWDYLDRYEAPTLRRLAREGVRAERLIPCFPTKTFPNHYSLVTGLYPDHHGIVSNTMYDPVFDDTFGLGDREAVEDARWWGGEPLWVTAEKQGRIAATYFWPGSEAAVQGVRPTYWMPYDHDVPGPHRIDQVLAWLDLPLPERPTFLTLYFSEVDAAGHDFGPLSEEVARAVRAVDGYLGRLVEGLRLRGLYETVNLVVVSDHGMADISSDRIILLEDYLDPEDVRVVEENPVLMLYPEAGREEAVYEGLKRSPHLSVYRKEEIPEALHFRAHYRIPPLVALADEGWSIARRQEAAANPRRYAGGNHGYDNRLESMHALFVARGPAFREGLAVRPFLNLHVYPLLAAVLGLEPAPHDGDLEAVRHVLK